MAIPIQPITSAPATISLPKPAGAAGPGGFQSVLSNAISSVESSSHNASQTVGRFLSGEGEEVHQTVMAAQEAELTFDLFLQMRNKVVQAYQEVMRMQM